MSLLSVIITGPLANVEALPTTAAAVRSALPNRINNVDLIVPECRIPLNADHGSPELADESLRTSLGKLPAVTLSSDIEVDFERAVADCQALGRQLAVQEVALSLNGVRLAVPTDGSLDGLRRQYLRMVCDSSGKNLNGGFYGDSNMLIRTACTIARLTSESCDFNFNGKSETAQPNETPEAIIDRLVHSR